MKKCKHCLTSKNYNEFYTCKKSNDGYRSKCKNCMREYGNQYRKENREICNLRTRISREKNPLSAIMYYDKNCEKYRKKTKDWASENTGRINTRDKRKRATDPIYKMVRMSRSMIKQFYFKNKGKRLFSNVYSVIGCDADFFRQYIREQFAPWMNDNNYGRYTGQYNETWQFDHVIPLNTANTVEEVMRLNHYTNLRPICSRKNLERYNYEYRNKTLLLS